MNTAGRWILLVVLFYGCGDGVNGTEPEFSEPEFSANIVAVGDGWWSCAVTCHFEGIAKNNGSGCAAEIRGTTFLYDSQGQEVGGIGGVGKGYPWRTGRSNNPALLGPGEEFTYRTVNAVTTPVRSEAVTHTAEISWTDVGC